MDPLAIRILDEELSNLSQEILEPDIIAGCISVFNDVDRQRITRECRERSAVHGVHELILRLKKRGPKAFLQFLEALQKSQLNDTYKRLHGKAIACGLFLQESVPNQAVERSCSDVSSRGPITTASVTSTSPSSNNTETVNFRGNSQSENVPANLGHECGVNAACSCSTDGNNSTRVKNNNSMHEEKPSKPQGPGTLLKDIQYKLKSQIVTDLAENTLQSDWRGLAGVAEFTVEQSQELRSKSEPMEALFQWMVQRQYTISTLTNMLRKLGRHDIITTISEYGYGEDSTSDENADEIVQEENRPASPSQVSESDSKESEEYKKGSHKLSQEATDGKEDEEGLTATTPLSEIPEDVVFLEEIKGKALLLGVEVYQNIETLHKLNRKVNELMYTIKADFTNWDVKSNVLGASRNCGRGFVLQEMAETYLKDVTRNDVCFIYIAGHTVQINGENYLLPMNVGTDLTVADIMDCSLNINQFLNELTRIKPLMLMLFIDGAHYNDVAFDAGSVLPGLASMVPPPRSVIVYPCKPGHVRPIEETLSFVSSMITALEVREGHNITPNTLLRELKEHYPSTFVFSLSPRSILPLNINILDEGPTIQRPSSDTPRYSLIFVDDVSAGDSRDHLLNDTEHLSASLEQLGWTVRQFVKSTCEDIRGTLKDNLRTEELAGNEMKVVMVYFIGFRAQDTRSLTIDQRSSVRLKWMIDVMCEHICGPKVLIVDDPSSHPLNFVTPLPPDVLMCLPTERELNDRSPVERDSFTLNLAQNLAANREGKLLNIIRTTAFNCRYQRVESNLFYA